MKVKLSRRRLESALRDDAEFARVGAHRRSIRLYRRRRYLIKIKDGEVDAVKLRRQRSGLGDIVITAPTVD